MKPLIETSVAILKQINMLVNDITDEDYSKPIELLSGNTIAKHIRHVLELNDEMLKGFLAGTINYEARQRNLLIEHNREYTSQFIDELIERLNQIKEDYSVELIASLDTETNNSYIAETSVKRELFYNIEHATHHMAIIQIIVKYQLPYIKLPDNFGVAISTIKYNKENVHANLRS